MLCSFVIRRVSSKASTAGPRAYRGYCTADIKVPIDLIKTLRTRTKAGISDCRSALAEAGLDLAKAEQILQSKAKVVAEKKSDRIAAEGLLGAVTDTSNRRVAVVEVRIHKNNLCF